MFVSIIYKLVWSKDRKLKFKLEVSENFKRIAKNNSSIFNNNYLPNIQLGSETNTNIQSIEIETPSGISGSLDDTQTDNSSAVLSIDYNIIDASGRKYNYKKYISWG